MKSIEPISIWDNGQIYEAKILTTSASSVVLNTCATFYYALYSENEDGTIGLNLTQGNLLMADEAYAQWEVDSYAWDWVAEQLKLTIIGDYIPPIPTTTSTTTTEVPTTSTTTTIVQ